MKMLKRVKEYLLSGFTWLIALIFFFPVFWMFLNSFKTNAEASGDPKLFFSPTLEQFREVINPKFWATFSDSFIIVIISTFFVMLLAIPTAYALAIKPIKKWKDVLFFFISTKFLPPVAGIIPIYILADTFNLLNSRTVLVILYTAMNLPLAVWMLNSFFREVPKELIEAAKIDGASIWSQITSVIMPIVAPGLAATALLCFIFAWNEFFFALQLNLIDNQTVPVWVKQSISTRDQFIAELSAASTLATLPVIIAGWAAQKKMIRGLSMGAIK